MKKINLFAVVAAVFALVSCSKDEMEVSLSGDSPRFTATIAGGTRTTVDVTNGKVVWNVSDEITVKDAADKTAIYKIESIDAESGEATFVIKNGQPAIGGGPYTATYGTEPAAVQNYSATAGELYMTASETTNNKLTFSVQCGLMKLNLTKADESVTMIAVTGTPDGGAETTYILNCKPQISISTARDFYIALPAGRYTKIEITSASDSRCVLKAAAGVEVATNHIKPVTFGESKLNFIPFLVDLGLSVKWASCNLGASTPDEYGDYYQWGGTTNVNATGIDLYFNNCPYHDASTNPYSGWLKYITSDKSSYWSGADGADNKFLLEPSDDAAHVSLGGDWRIPTAAEWEELNVNCTWKWTGKGYLVTSKVPGYEGKSIFIPAAGYRMGDGFSSQDYEGDYWTSSLCVETPEAAHKAIFDAYSCRVYHEGRFAGYPIRPVQARHRHKLTKVPGKINRLGEPGCIEAYKCTDPLCSLYFEDEAESEFIGSEADYKNWKSEGGHGYLAPVPEVVDLGLSVKWRTCNIDATRPEEYGGYYQWGGTEDVSSMEKNLLHYGPYYEEDDRGNGHFTKYSKNGKIFLDLEDDAAHVKLGGNWHIPTPAEWEELINNCTWTWTNYNGVNGYKGVSKKVGYTDNWIFLPAGGHIVWYMTRFSSVGSDGFYYTSRFHLGYMNDEGEHVRFDSDDQPYVCYDVSFDRREGMPLRPVTK